MGEKDQLLEVRVAYVIPEGTDELVWDVRVRTSLGQKFRLVDMDMIHLADPVLSCPALRPVEQVMERWLTGAGVQLSLPFS